MVGLVVHGADVQDRDGAPTRAALRRRRYPWLRHVFADGDYGSEKLRSRLSTIGSSTVQVVKRTDKVKGFELLPRRWVVERTFACSGAAGGSPRTSKLPSPAPRPESSSPTSASSHEDSPGITMPADISSRALRPLIH
jgi:transposase